MRASLEFRLPDEREDYEAAYNGIRLKIAGQDVMDLIRRKLKYSELTEVEAKIYQELRTQVYEIYEGLI